AGVWRLDTDSLRVVATVAVPGGLGATPGSVAVTAGAVWVSDPARAIVWRLDPERNRLVGSVPADGWDLAVGSDQTVWAASGNRLLGLDRGGLRHTLLLGQLGSDRINAITAGPDALWVAAPTGLFRGALATRPCPASRSAPARGCGVSDPGQRPGDDKVGHDRAGGAQQASEQFDGVVPLLAGGAQHTGEGLPGLNAASEPSDGR